jgi:hypothetical protein
MESDKGIINTLDRIFIISITDGQEVSFNEMTGGSKFIALRNEIYRYEYLHGMPSNAPVYFKNLVDISNNARIFCISRPGEIKILDMMELLMKNLGA